MTLKGVVESGRREAAGFLRVPWVAEQIREKLGFEPFPGTLNLKLHDGDSLNVWKSLRETPGMVLASPDPAFCDASCYPVLIEGKTPGAIVLPLVESYYADVIEVVAGAGLRERFGLRDGDPCALTFDEDTIWKSRVRAVLFDFEGTLVDFQWRLAEAEAELRTVLLELGFELEPFVRDNYAVLRSRALELTRSEKLKQEIDVRFGEVYDRFDQDAGSRWSLKPDAPDLLRALRSSGCCLALVSNVGRSTLEKVLDRLGLSTAFDVVVTRNDVEHAKPSGEGFLKALSLLGLSPADAVVVGDSLSDLLAARAAGTRVVILTGGESPAREILRYRPDRVLSSLSEVGMLLSPCLENATGHPHT